MAQHALAQGFRRIVRPHDSIKLTAEDRLKLRDMKHLNTLVTAFISQ
jgi:hypothetical protein